MDGNGLVTGFLPAASFLLAAFILAEPIIARQQAPWFGTWVQDLSAPARLSPLPYKKVTVRIEPWRDGLRVVYDMVRTRGGITHIEWEGKFDGGDYPVQGVDSFLTNAYRQLDGRSYEVLIKVDGRPAATATAVVSEDGRTLTVTTVEQGRQSTAVYRRQ